MKYSRIYCSLLAAMIFSSCNAPIYNTNKLHAPLLNSKEDAQVEATWVVLQGPCISGAYAITENLAIKGSAFFSNYSYNDSSYIHQRAFELGLGRYGFILGQKPYEVYLTFMNGKSNFSGLQSSWSGQNGPMTKVASDYWRITIQADFMTNNVWVKDRKFFQDIYFDHAIATRIAFINFFHYNEIKNDDRKEALVIDDKAPQLLSFEIASVLKYGAYPFFLEAQIGLDFPFVLNKGIVSVFPYANPFIVSVGASLCFY